MQKVLILLKIIIVSAVITALPTEHTGDANEEVLDATQDDFLLKIDKVDAIKKILSSARPEDDGDVVNGTDAKPERVPLHMLPSRCLFNHQTALHAPHDFILDNTPIQDKLVHPPPPHYNNVGKVSQPLPRLVDVIKNYMSGPNAASEPISAETSSPSQTNVVTSAGVSLPRPFIVHKAVLPSGNTLYYTYRHLMPTANQISMVTTPAPTTTTMTTTTTMLPAATSSTEDQATDNYPPLAPGEPMYEQKMKFVLPYPLPAPSPASTNPWQFDPYAYYPTAMRPSYMHIPAPYAPTYHMIRTLSIPNEYDNKVAVNSKLPD